MRNDTISTAFNLQETISENRFAGLWRLMRGFRMH